MYLTPLSHHPYAIMLELVTGGKERSEKEFEALASGAGF